MPQGSQFDLFAVGDVAPRRERPAEMFAAVAGLLNRGDLVFAQLETTLSDRGAPLPQARLAMRAPPAVAKAIRDAGIDVVSFAGNHCLDWGPDAFADTLNHARAAGLQVCGAGAGIAHARKPAIIEVDGTTVAVLAYSSILPQDYAATETRAGCAPMRAHTLYEQIEHDQPGTAARMHTFPHREDLAALRLDVRAARALADVVVLSIHWGIHFIPAEIADYQREVAHAAIDEGCDAVFGHHPHILKGIEFRHGRPIFYSLGNFAIEQPQAFAEDLFATRGFQEISALNPGFDTSRAFIAPPDTQKSLIAKLRFAGGRLTRIAFQPVIIGDDAVPLPLSSADPRFREVTDYIAEIGVSQGLSTAFAVEGDDVVVSAAGS